jgi:hypothetical protein
MSRKAQMSIGQPIASIPRVKRAHQHKTRLDQVVKALKKAQPGQVLPIYMGSKYAAANLAGVLKKSKQVAGEVAVRKHIVYVEVAPRKASAPEPAMTLAASKEQVS